jgi:hypothetical protein
LGIPCVVFSSFCFLCGGDFKEVIQLSVQVTFAVVGAGVVEICSVSNVDFAPDGGWLLLTMGRHVRRRGKRRSDRQFSRLCFRIQSSLFLSSLFNNHVQHFWFTWRASEPRKARYSMYGQLDAVYGRARGMQESERRTKTLCTVCMGRCHAFSNSPHRQVLTIGRGAGGRARKRSVKLCMGSRTQCTDARETRIAMWRKHATRNLGSTVWGL